QRHSWDQHPSIGRLHIQLRGSCWCTIDAHLSASQYVHTFYSTCRNTEDIDSASIKAHALVRTPRVERSSCCSITHGLHLETCRETHALQACCGKPKNVVRLSEESESCARGPGIDRRNGCSVLECLKSTTGSRSGSCASSDLEALEIVGSEA